MDYSILNSIDELKDDHEYSGDFTNMPLAPHRYKQPDYQSSVWWFHKTETSMQDFVSFVQYESTQAKLDHDFYLGRDKNRTSKDGNLIPKDQMIHFEPG